MRRILLILILSLALSQCKKSGFPELETDPLKAAFQQNGISGYYEIDSSGDSVYTVHVDSNGNIISRENHLKMWPSTTTFTFDSLGRVAGNYHHSDISYTYKVEYDYLPNDNLVKQHWIEISGKEPKHDWTHLYKVDGSSKRPVQMIRIDAKKGDTLDITTYYWKSSKIWSEVTTSDIYPTHEKKYFYNKKGKLDRTEFWSDGRMLQADYISVTTGLVDSSIDRHKEVIYTRYF